MDRRSFLKTTGLAAAATAAGSATSAAAPDPQLAAPAVHAGVRELRLSMAWPDSVAGLADNAYRLAARIEEATGRRFRVHIEAERDGAAAAFAASDADLYHAVEHDNAAHDPAFSYFAGLPFSSGLAPADLENWLTIGGGQELWDELAADLGYKPLLAGHIGRAPRLWSNRPLNSLGEFEGLRVATMGPEAEVMRALGAVPVSISAREIGAALRRGDLDAAEFGGALQAMAAGVAPAARLAYEVDASGAGTAVTLGVSRRLWDSLTPSDQTVFAACASEAYRLAIAESDTHEHIILKALCDLHGVTAAPIAAEVSAALPPITEAVVAMLAASSPRAQRINASYMAFRRATGGARPATAQAPIA